MWCTQKAARRICMHAEAVQAHGESDPSYMAQAWRSATDSGSVDSDVQESHILRV